MSSTEKETILCAAIWYDDGKRYNLQPTNVSSGIVVAGYRHPQCKILLMSWLYPDWQNDDLQTMIKNEVNRKEVQGFLTSHNRFLDRKEAALLFVANGGTLKYSQKRLYSEDLY